jgi:hypothetical protein
MMLSFFLTNAFEQMALGVQEKRLQEVLQYQTLLTDLEQWLSTVNATLRTETRPSSPKAIRDQLLAHEVSIPTVRQDLVMCVTNNFKVLSLFLTGAGNITKNLSFLEHDS